MLDARLSADGTSAALAGELVFSDHKIFRDLQQKMTGSPARALRLDLTGLTFIDSAGLGMLLLLREEAGKSGQSVVLANAGSQVKRMFAISKFDTIFTVE